MQINGKKESLDATLDAGVEVLEKALESLQRRGLSFELGSSVLAVAVAGAMTYEQLSEDQFLEIIRQTLRFWRLDSRPEGPVLVFNTGLDAIAPVPGNLTNDSSVATVN